MSEVATRPAKRNGAMVPVAQPVADTLLAMLGEGMSTMDAAKFEVMVRMIARIQFDRAMSDAQGEMQPVVRSIPNSVTNSKYADLEAIDTAIRPIYARHGFSLSFTEIPTEGATVRIACKVKREGHEETHHLEAQSDTHGPQGKPNKTPIQGVVSAVTYLRRALTAMVFNIATKGEDNDGNRQRPPDTGEIISRKQAAELRALMAETRIEETRVIAVKKLGIATIDELPVEKFAAVLGDLISRRKVQQQRTTSMGEAA